MHTACPYRRSSSPRRNSAIHGFLPGSNPSRRGKPDESALFHRTASPPPPGIPSRLSAAASRFQVCKRRGRYRTLPRAGSGRRFGSISPQRQAYLGRGEELCALVPDHIIFFASDSAGFYLQHEIIFRKALEQSCGDVEVLLQGEITSVEHVAGEEI